MIKAYHQVGVDGMKARDISKLMERVAKLGRLLPATMRLSRGEMELECFDASRFPIRERLKGGRSMMIEVMEDIARERISVLPEDGSPQSMFNCIDLIAGDLDLVFLSIGDWYAIPTGFVFDAEELLARGAVFRPADIMGELGYRLEEISRWNYGRYAEARRAIEEVAQDVIERNSLKGAAARRAIKRCLKEGEGACPVGELVWEGPLPLELAVEAWDGNVRIW